MLKDFNLFEAIKDLIFPPLCSVCGKISVEFICSECRSRIKSIDGKVCKYCGRPILDYTDLNYEENIDDVGTSGVHNKFCSLCRRESFNFYRLRSFALYKGEIRKIIQKYKYYKLHDLGVILIGFLKKVYDRYYSYEKIDFIDTVPDFDYDRENSTGNHMQILCKQISKIFNISFIDNIIKIKRTPKQQGLSLYQRKNNLKDAFKVRDCLLVSGKDILLIDDVWTTGSTLNEIGTVLKRAGANKIYLLTIARGI